MEAIIPVVVVAVWALAIIALVRRRRRF